MLTENKQVLFRGVCSEPQIATKSGDGTSAVRKTHPHPATSFTTPSHPKSGRDDCAAVIGLGSYRDIPQGILIFISAFEHQSAPFPVKFSVG
jgi:hypothetical protein